MFVQPEDLLKLAGLGGRPFEELLFDLIVAEASRHGIPPTAVHWDHRVNIGDGGRDIVVEAEHHDPNPRFVPRRPSIWSAKSGENGTKPSTLRTELTDPRHVEVRQHLQQGNPYVWSPLQPLSEDGAALLLDEARAVAEDSNAYVFDPALVEIRRLTTLCAILNDHPGLIAKHFPSLNRMYEGVLNLAEWEQQDRAGFSVQWVDLNAHRAGSLSRAT
jgi:hypothetical protein